jgi:hypothetical protein
MLPLSVADVTFCWPKARPENRKMNAIHRGFMEILPMNFNRRRVVGIKGG